MRWPRVTLALCLSVWAAASVARAQDTPADRLLDRVGFDQRLDAQVPLDLEFRDENGDAVALRDYFAKRPVILTPVYYQCPMLCNLVLKGLVSALGVLSFDVGKDFDIVTFSFDPRDTPKEAAEKKRTMLERYGRPGAAAGWHFLTGQPEAIKRLTDAIGFRYAYDEERGQFAHAGGVIVLTPEGRVSRYFYGIEYSPKDLRLGLVEASRNQIGTVVDQLLLYCYQYDPSTGKYSAISMNAVRMAGVLTLLALGSFVGVMLWRDRSGHRTSRPQEH